MSEQTTGKWFNGPQEMKTYAEPANPQTLIIGPAHQKNQDILQAIAALADGVTRRDRQLHLMAEQLGRIEQASERGGVKGQETRESLNAISRQIAANQQKTMELFVAIDVRLKAMEERGKPRKQKRAKR